MKKHSNKLFSTTFIAACIAGSMASTDIIAQNTTNEEKVAYLFTYFNGNAPHEEQKVYKA